MKLLPYRKQPAIFRMDIDKLAPLAWLLACYGLDRSERINRCIDYGLEHLPEFGLGEEGVAHRG